MPYYSLYKLVILYTYTGISSLFLVSNCMDITERWNGSNNFGALLFTFDQEWIFLIWKLVDFYLYFFVRWWFNYPSQIQSILQRMLGRSCSPPFTLRLNNIVLVFYPCIVMYILQDSIETKLYSIIIIDISIQLMSNFVIMVFCDFF